MNKYLIITTFLSGFPVSACELINGVTINEPGVCAVFETARSTFANNQDLSKEIDDLYVRYLCLIAQHGEREAYSKGGDGIIQQVNNMIRFAS